MTQNYFSNQERQNKILYHILRTLYLLINIYKMYLSI